MTRRLFAGSRSPYNDGQQHDAGEFLSDVLGRLEETVVEKFIGVEIEEDRKFLSLHQTTL